MAQRKRIGLVNYGSGNFNSCYNALRRIGVEPVEASDTKVIGSITHLILPGVGAFVAAMRRLDSLGIADAIRSSVLERRTPLLGICVGMQVLAESGEEHEPCLGLGLIAGRVVNIQPTAPSFRLPHVGWNDIAISQHTPLFSGFNRPPSFYFVHSFQFQTEAPSETIATCDYGTRICAAVAKDNVFGVQFHPEKSQQTGLRLLHNFCSLPSSA